jgi:uncharacterized membrane protein
LKRERNSEIIALGKDLCSLKEMAMKSLYAGPPLKELHEEYAKKGKIDENAPVKSVEAITIDAPVATVWQLLGDLRNWTRWRSDAHVTRLGPIEPDAPFRWKIRGASIRSTFAVVAAEREIAWTGVAMGWIKAVDRCRLASTEDGRTTVTMEESMSGPLLTFFYTSGKLRKGHQDALRMLKTAAECLAPGS